MNKTLDQMTEKWMQMERNTPEQIEKANNFYDETIMPLIEEDYISRNNVEEEIQYLIVSVGTSCEPIILNIKLFHPEKILFLYTTEAESTLDKIVSYTRLLPSSYEKCKVSPVESAGCYQAIKRCYLEWGRPKKIYIDFTGGTKAMSTAAAMAGTFINVQVVYVGNTHFLKSLRKPKPGSETLYHITNPWLIFGDLEIEKAFSFFGQYAYAGAIEKIKEIQKNMSNPIIHLQLEYARMLACAYKAWDAFNFTYAANNMSDLVKLLDRDSANTGYLLMDFMEPLKRQAEILEKMKKIQSSIQNRSYEAILSDKEAYTALMFTMYQCACIREQQEKYDMSTLLFYRLLEMIIQKRLYCYHLLASDMNYENMDIHPEQIPEWKDLGRQERISRLKDNFSDIKKRVFQMDGACLPEKAGLLDGLIILSVFHDPITEPYSKNMTDFLNNVRSMADLRNSSIFAHGFNSIVWTKQYEKFQKFLKKQFLNFCQIEEIDFDTYLKHIKWINPSESVNYPIG